MKLIKYTPIKCYKTNVALNLGDFVMDCQNRCGTLEWDDYLNQYYIKPIVGGKIKTQNYIKIDKLFNYNIDTTKVECRKNHLKQKW
jgi:hypothetical protein